VATALVTTAVVRTAVVTTAVVTTALCRTEDHRGHCGGRLGNTRRAGDDALLGTTFLAPARP
jgi:hypothetical protein